MDGMDWFSVRSISASETVFPAVCVSTAGAAGLAGVDVTGSPKPVCGMTVLPVEDW